MKAKIDRILETLQDVVEDKKEFAEIKSLLDNYFKALGPLSESEVKDFKKLKELKPVIFNYEKKYIPIFKENLEVTKQLKPDNLILTLGLSPEPVILSILCFKPKRVFLLHTDESLNQAAILKQDKHILDLDIQISCHKITEYDAKENYRVVKKLIENISGSTVVDPTGGRKIMIASVSLASFYYRLPMVYMHSEDLKRQVVPLSDRLHIIENPLYSYGDTDLTFIENLFNAHMYEAAAKVADSLKDSIKDVETTKKMELLSELLTVYRDWDAFKHSTPDEKVKISIRLARIFSDMKKFKLTKWLPENIENNIKFLKEVERLHKRNSFNMTDEFRIVDVYLSALRRGSEKQGKYDDAVARLYRCIEMCATYVLKKKFGLNSTESPDYEKIAKRAGKSVKEIKEEFHKNYNHDLPDCKLGLDNQMKLLKLLGPSNLIPKIYLGMEDLMKMRNRSILAHGSRPCTETDWSQFREKTKVIIENVIGKEDFNLLYEMAKHGFIDLSRI